MPLDSPPEKSELIDIKEAARLLAACIAESPEDTEAPNATSPRRDFSEIFAVVQRWRKLSDSEE